MKRLITLFILLTMTCVLSAQVSTRNYIRTRTMLDTLGTSYVDGIAYYDGLGRPFQTVNKSVQNGTVMERLATLQEYDAMGRETNTWLPVPVTADYVTASVLQITAQGTDGYSDTHPYNKTVYETSPLNRIISRYGAGAAWHDGHPVATDYLTNTSTAGDTLACKLYTTDGETLSGGTSYYAAATLYVVKTIDEDGNASYTFTDKQDRLLLERRMNGTEQLDTYYVYDDYGNLCFVLQPMYQEEADLDKFAFQYRYDHRNRCVWKKLPGTEYVTYTYNDYDQLTFSQDGNQRTSGKWTFYVYDNLNRLVQQGISNGKNTSGTTMIKNYYDDYSFIGTSGFTGYYIKGNAPANGLLTASVITLEGGNGETVRYAYYYDEKGRVIKTVHTPLRGGTYLTTATYTFTGKPLHMQKIYFHGESGVVPIVEYIDYTYDSYDRLQDITHQRMGISGLSAVKLVTYTYDNLGRISKQSFHNGIYENTYGYNVRGWMTDVNSSKFSQDLTYNNGTSGYNGNITVMNWTANDDSHSYAFTYDGLNRLTDAEHGIGTYTERVTGYDKNGNILALQRYGNGLIDNLTYIYNGNQLTQVEDATGNATGFKNGSNQTNEYTYDNNGNLTKDLNKDIASITYNSLNLPKKITYSDGGSVTYLYGADGKKYRTIHIIDGDTTTTEYIGNLIYVNDIIQKMLTENGYMDLTDNSYHYYIKDHQGNNRLVIDSEGNVEEVNHYYPSGSMFSTSTNVQPYKYNGKELDTKNGLNWYDYGARRYDAALGRWFVMDPLAEKMYGLSPYGYCFNNPVKFVDEDGEMPWLVAAAVGALVDYGFQVAQNVITGQSIPQSLTNVDMKSIAASASISATGVGLANVVTKGVKAVQVGAKIGKALQIASDVAVDATMSAASQIVSREGISAEKVAIDVVSGSVGGKMGNKAKVSSQNSETGKLLHRKANRAQRLAGENSRASRKEQAAKAIETANNYGENVATAVSTVVSSMIENEYDWYNKKQ